MFGQSGFVGLPGAGGEVRLAQAPMPTAAPPSPAPAPVGPPLPVSTPDVTATSGLSHGAQVAIGATILAATILGMLFLTD